MSAPSIQSVANSRALRLAGSTIACGLSLALVVGGAFHSSVISEFTKIRPSRGVVLSVLNPLLKLERPHFRTPAAIAPPVLDILPTTAPAPLRAVTAAKREIAIRSELRKRAMDSIRTVLANPSSAPKLAIRKQVAPKVTRNVSLVHGTAFTRKPTAAPLTRPVNADAHWKEILEIAEYITGDNLGMQAPVPLEHRGVLIAEVTSLKPIEVIDGGPSLEDTAWLALVKDAKRIEKIAAVEPKRVTPKLPKRVSTELPKASAQAKVPRVYILAADPAEKMAKAEPPVLAESEAAPAPKTDAALALRPINTGKVHDQVTNLVGAMSRDLVATDKMGIQEDSAEGDAAAGEIVTFAKGVLKAEQAEPPQIKLPPISTGTNVAQNDVVDPNPNKDAGINAVGSDSKYVELIGKLANEARGYPGHFEVGFYKAVSAEGVPIGAPVLQSMLRNKQLEFRLNTPRAAQGFLFARFISADSSFKAKEWYGYPSALDLREVRGNQVLLTIPINKTDAAGTPAVAIASIKQAADIVLKGRVGAMFSPKGTLLPLEGTKVRLRGTKIETSSQKTGRYTLKIPNARGRVLLEFLKPGYMPRVVEVGLDGSSEITVPDATIASREAIRHMAQSLGLQQGMTGSVLILETKGRQGDAGLPGISAQMSLKSDGPFYFSEKGFPQRELKASTIDGRMIFFNVEPGVGFLETFVLGENFTPFAIAPLGEGEAMAQSVEFLDGEARVTGKLFDPIVSRSGRPIPINGAKVRVAGGAEWTETDSFGNFELPNFKFVRGSEILIEVTKHGYYNHRFAYRIPAEKSAMKEIQLFAFPQEYINKLATSVEIELNPDFGMLLGKIGGTDRMRVDALLDHSGDNGAKDFYFDSHNVIQGAHALTDPHFGTYMIFDVSPGRVLLHGHNQAGEMRYADISYFSPSTVNVIISE